MLSCGMDTASLSTRAGLHGIHLLGDRHVREQQGCSAKEEVAAQCFDDLGTAAEAAIDEDSEAEETDHEQEEGTSDQEDVAAASSAAAAGRELNSAPVPQLGSKRLLALESESIISHSSSSSSSPSRGIGSPSDGDDGDDEGVLQRPRSFRDNSAAATATATPSSTASSPLSVVKYRDHHRIRPGRWVAGEHIGRGSFGSVCKAMNTETGVEFAVKEIYISAVATSASHTEAGLDALTREIEVMRSLSHPNIVRYLGYEVSISTTLAPFHPLPFAAAHLVHVCSLFLVPLF